MEPAPKRVLVTGGAGYLGCVLVPKLLAAGYEVAVLDVLWFGRPPLAGFVDHPHCRVIVADLCRPGVIDDALESFQPDAIVHLAAISNDPSAEIDAHLTRAVNRDAVQAVMHRAKAHGVQRLLYASSASVYGIKSTPNVTEELPLEPLTLYARYKAEGEAVLERLVDDDFVGVSVRAATVCGVSPRMRLDLTINILTEHAVHRGEIRVFGGSQMRPNIHIEDLTDFYVALLTMDAAKINGRAFNVSTENASVMSLAERIRDRVDASLPVRVVPTDDTRSYHLCADRAAGELGFAPSRTLDDAIADVHRALTTGAIPDAAASIYRNVVHMKEHPELWGTTKGYAAPQ